MWTASYYKTICSPELDTLKLVSYVHLAQGFNNFTFM